MTSSLFTQFAYGHPSHAPEGELKGIRFAIWNDRDINAGSVVDIRSTKARAANGLPNNEGLDSLLLGTVDHGLLCQTCDMSGTDCPGHWGRIHLTVPLFHRGFFDAVIKVLQCVCHVCSHMRVGLDHPKKGAKLRETMRMRRGMERLSAVAELCRGVPKCSNPECNMPCPNKVYQRERILHVEYRPQDHETLVINDRPANQTVTAARIALQVLDRIRDDDAKIMGFDPEVSHPRAMILTVLPVPPPHVRPQIMQVG